jgi:NAD(P)-dependent dehydrogenase (short-subunit alcohol dehydrogenase family)
MGIVSTENYLPAPVSPKCPPQKWLAGQTALVTGASSGIGKEIALALGAYGANVVVNFVSDEAKAWEIAGMIKSSGVEAIAYKADVSSEAQVESMFGQLLRQFGTLDILINNAGLQQDAAIENLTLAQWNKVIGVNLTGQFLCSRAAIREFKRRGVRNDVSCSAGIEHADHVAKQRAGVSPGVHTAGPGCSRRQSDFEIAMDFALLNSKLGCPEVGGVSRVTPAQSGGMDAVPPAEYARLAKRRHSP